MGVEISLCLEQIFPFRWVDFDFANIFVCTKCCGNKHYIIIAMKIKITALYLIFNMSFPVQLDFSQCKSALKIPFEDQDCYLFMLFFQV